MHKKFFNHYKLRRHLKRRMGHGRSASLHGLEEPETSTRDFAWHEARLNPYYREPDTARNALYVFCIAASCVGVVAILLYHPMFHLTKVSIAGFERIPENELRSTVSAVLENTILGILPGRSYLVADIDEIRTVLENTYPLSKISVRKQFPNQITIELEEKLSTVIYDNGMTYSTLGLDGRVLQIWKTVSESEWVPIKTEAVTTTKADGRVVLEEKVLERVHRPDIVPVTRDIGPYPIIYRENAPEVRVNDVAISSGTVTSTIQWYEHLRESHGISLTYVLLRESGGDAELHTAEGWHIKCRLGGSMDGIASFDAILKRIGGRRGLTYIDVRYPGKVFWQ